MPVTRIDSAARFVLRWGLVLVLLWFGAFKFTAAEAEGIRPLVSHSPFMSWLYSVMDARGVSRLIGTSEILAALLLALHPLRPRLSALGSLLAVGIFATTLSFLATTPGAFANVEGLVVPSATGSFLIKDLFLFGAALATLGEALGARQKALVPSPSLLVRQSA